MEGKNKKAATRAASEPSVSRLQRAILDAQGGRFVLRIGTLVAQYVEGAGDDLVFLAVVDLGRSDLDAAHGQRQHVGVSRRAGGHGVSQRDIRLGLEVVEIGGVLQQHRELARAKYLATRGGR